MSDDEKQKMKQDLAQKDHDLKVANDTATSLRAKIDAEHARHTEELAKMEMSAAAKRTASKKESAACRRSVRTGAEILLNNIVDVLGQGRHVAQIQEALAEFDKVLSKDPPTE